MSTSSVLGKRSQMLLGRRLVRVYLLLVGREYLQSRYEGALDTDIPLSHQDELDQYIGTLVQRDTYSAFFRSGYTGIPAWDITPITLPRRRLEEKLTYPDRDVRRGKYLT